MFRRSEATGNEAIILSLLANGERYGLEIRKLYKQHTGRSLPYGSLYTTLHRMEDKRLVKSRYSPPPKEGQGNRRKYFRLTAQGSEALAGFEALLRQIGEIAHG